MALTCHGLGRLPHLIWGPGCSSPCLSIWGTELLPPMAAQGLESLPDKAAGRTKGTSEIQFFSMGGIIYGLGEMPWLPQQSPGRGWYFQLKAEGQSAAMPTSEGNEHTAKSHLPPNHSNVPRSVTKSSCWNCAALGGRPCCHSYTQPAALVVPCALAIAPAFFRAWQGGFYGCELLRLCHTVENIWKWSCNA